ncbi:MAG: hypothetical protein IJZ68_08000 [Bacteroidaceae bacterium]|nr:hypothetical protein [Bacteroidaceae bacterium]
MDINTPIEITENSTGLDMLNEVRRAFSVYFFKEIQKVMSIPVVDDKQARMLSQHLTQRLGTMRVLTILGENEVDQATDALRQFISGSFPPTAIVFAPVEESSYSKVGAADMMVLWNAVLQQFFTHCLTSGAKQADMEERNRMYAFAENAVYCWHDLRMMMPGEIKKAQEIIKEFRAGNTTVDTKYTGADIPDIT